MINYKSYIGPLDRYDLMAASQFNLLTTIGLRETHTLLDIGCGSLRGGKLFIPYLLPEKYYGVEPNQWLIDDGIENEVGQSQIDIKKPRFSNTDVFDFSVFNTKFDFLLAQSIFSHSSSKQMQSCIVEAEKVMHDNSVFIATFYHADVNYEGDVWVYPNVVGYTFEHIIDLASDVGLSVFDVEWVHYGKQTWFALMRDECTYSDNHVFPMRRQQPIFYLKP